MPVVDPKTVVKLVRPRPLHSVVQTRSGESPPHFGQGDAAIKNVKCVRRLPPLPPLRVFNAATSNAPARDSEEGASSPFLSGTSELTPKNSEPSTAPPEREVLDALKTLISDLVEDVEISVGRIADACDLIRSRGPELGEEHKELLDNGFEKLRTISCDAKLPATIRLMLLELIELQSWEWTFSEALEKFYAEIITAQSDLGSGEGTPTPSEKAPVLLRTVGPQKMSSKKDFKEKFPPNISRARKGSHQDRTFGDDVTNKPFPLMDDRKDLGGFRSGHHSDTAAGRDTTQSIKTGEMVADTAMSAAKKDTCAHNHPPNRTEFGDVSYSRDFLLQCSRSPFSTELPPDFPPLDPSIETIMVKKRPAPFDPDHPHRRPAHRGSRAGKRGKLRSDSIKAQNGRGSNPEKLTSGGLTPASKPETGPGEQKAAEEPKKNVQPNSDHGPYIGHGNRIVGDDVNTQEPPVVDNCGISDASRSDHTRDAAAGGDAATDETLAKPAAESTVEGDCLANFGTPNRLQPAHASYSRDFLLECSRSPFATELPPDFPQLDPSIESIMVKQTPMPFDPDLFKTLPTRPGPSLVIE